MLENNQRHTPNEDFLLAIIRVKENTEKRIAFLPCDPGFDSVTWYHLHPVFTGGHIAYKNAWQCLETFLVFATRDAIGI